MISETVQFSAANLATDIIASQSKISFYFLTQAVSCLICYIYEKVFFICNAIYFMYV